MLLGICIGCVFNDRSLALVGCRKLVRPRPRFIRMTIGMATAYGCFLSQACDAYAFGIVMWELYTGQRPYSDMFNNARDKRMRDKLILSKVAHENLRPTFPESKSRGV